MQKLTVIHSQQWAFTSKSKSARRT